MKRSLNKQATIFTTKRMVKIYKESVGKKVVYL